MATGGSMPESYTTLGPVIKTPFGDIVNLPVSKQGTPCGFFESQFYRCMEAYGAKLGRKYCDLERRDQVECLTKEKQIKRAEAIGAQRRKLFAEGKLDAPYLNDFPAPGHFKTDYYAYNPREQ